MALLCLAPESRFAVFPAHASTVKLHYEDTFDDVRATKETAAEVKAAFLLRFPDFIRWEESLGDTLHIGVTGDSILLGMLERLVTQENKPGLGTPQVVAIKQVSDPSAARGCSILVLGESAPADFLQAMSAAPPAGILTVGVWDEPRGGAIIRLFRDGSRVRFDISRTLAKEAGLKISSKLLILARETTSLESPSLPPRTWG